MAFSNPQQKLKEVVPRANTEQTSPDGDERLRGFAADLWVFAEEFLLKTGHGLAI